MVLFGYGSLILSIMALAVCLWARRHYLLHRTLKAERRGETYEDFRVCFAAQNVPEPLLHSIYALFSQQIALVSDFPVRPLDSLHSLYGIESLSGADMAEVMEALGMEGAYCDSMDKPPLCTVADLVFRLAAYSAVPESQRSLQTPLEPLSYR